MTMTRRGFTMIEMLAVLAFMVIIMGVSIPAVTNISRSEAASELGMFQAFVKKTFMQSVRRNEYLRLVVDMQSGDYWVERTETPFFLMTGQEQESYDKQNARLLEEYDESERSLGSLKAGSSATSRSLFDLLGSQGDDTTYDADDLYHWENFVPERRNIRELLKPEYQPVSERRRVPSGLQWRQFFSYHTPEVLTPEEAEEKERKAIAYVYFFPQGRISPFFLSIGEKEGEPILHIAVDMYLGIKIGKGELDEEVKGLVQKSIEEDADEEGK